MSGDNSPQSGGRQGIPRPLSGGPIAFGPYMLDARLAVGGTAEVYLARPIDPQGDPRRLIVKRLLPHFAGDPEGRTMFEREAELHAAVHHENVVMVFGSGHAENGEPYLAMEYVEGADCYRLLRRLAAENQRLAPSVAVYLACEILRALESVHSALDDFGQPLRIVHRDVTPSNLYISKDGRVKLGDFGIARSAGRATLGNAASAMLKGKFAYLAPEQVAGEPFDHRADLFSLAVVLSEMLLNKPLFGGSGQLAVLLAIRDCRIDPLREAKDTLPPGLFEVIEKALSRDPTARYASAAEFLKALRPFERPTDSARNELAAMIRWVQSVPSLEAIAAARESTKLRAASAIAAATQEDDDHSKPTGKYNQLPCHVETASGVRFGPWSYAQLIEAISTGHVGRGDQVDYMGRGLKPIEEVEELVRFLPAHTATTNNLGGLGVPDFCDDISPMALLSVFLRVLEAHETGVLFAENATPSGADSGRKELYFRGGKLFHVASTNASELLGEYLARRKMISRDELDFALAVLPRYGGRMGDTLISLGLVNAVDIFRAIREQGRDRVMTLFSWKKGRLMYYVGQTARQVEFPLELELPPLMLTGLELALPAEAPMQTFRKYLDVPMGVVDEVTESLRDAAWPESVTAVVQFLKEQPMPLRQVLAELTKSGERGADDVLRIVQLLLTAKMVRWVAG